MALRDFKLALAAGVSQNLTVDGDFFGVLESENFIYVSIDNGPAIKRIGGHFQSGENYLTVKVTSLVDQNCLLLLGRGSFYSANQNVNITATAVIENGNQNAAKNDVIVPAGGSIQVVGANATRKAVIIKSLYSNDPASLVRVGVGASAVKGAELIAGDALPPLETTGAIDAYNPTAIAVTLSILEINRV